MSDDEDPEDVRAAIQKAELLLPGIPSPPDAPDPRWQAIINIGYFIESAPEHVWQFIVRWGGHEQEDLRNAIACCLSEHLLEYHFDVYFPRVVELTSTNCSFADCFLRCWKFGEAEIPKNASRFDTLQADCRERVGRQTDAAD